MTGVSCSCQLSELQAGRSRLPWSRGPVLIYISRRKRRAGVSSESRRSRGDCDFLPPAGSSARPSPPSPVEVFTAHSDPTSSGRSEFSPAESLGVAGVWRLVALNCLFSSTGPLALRSYVMARLLISNNLPGHRKHRVLPVVTSKLSAGNQLFCDTTGGTGASHRPGFRPRPLPSTLPTTCSGHERSVVLAPLSHPAVTTRRLLLRSPSLWRAGICRLTARLLFPEAPLSRQESRARGQSEGRLVKADG